MECFRLLLEHVAWIEYQFLSGIRDSRKAGSLWQMMRGVGGVKKSTDQSWLAKGLGLGLLCWVYWEFRKRFLGKRPALFKSGLWHFHEDNAPVQNPILVTDYLTKMGIKTVPQPTYSPDLVPCNFCLFPKLRGCRYETIEEMKEAVTKVIDTLTQQDLHGVFQKLLEWYNKRHCSRRRLLRRGLEFHVCTINKSAHLFNVLRMYIYIYIYTLIIIMSRCYHGFFLFSLYIYIYSSFSPIASSRSSRRHPESLQNCCC